LGKTDALKNLAIVGGIGLGAYVLYSQYKKMQEFEQGLEGFFGGIGQGFQTIFGGIGQGFQNLLNWVGGGGGGFDWNAWLNNFRNTMNVPVAPPQLVSGGGITGQNVQIYGAVGGKPAGYTGVGKGATYEYGTYQVSTLLGGQQTYRSYEVLGKPFSQMSPVEKTVAYTEIANIEKTFSPWTEIERRRTG